MSTPPTLGEEVKLAPPPDEGVNAGSRRSPTTISTSRFQSWLNGLVSKLGFQPVITLLLTFALVIIGYWSLQAARESAAASARSAAAAEKSAQIAETALTRSERAYVGFIGVLTDRDFEAGEVVVSTRFTNSGKTPALDVRYQATIRLAVSMSRLPDVSPSYLPAPKGTSVIAPGTTISPTFGEPARLSAELVGAMKGGEKTLYVFGRLTYKDVFDKEHQTVFCSVYDGTRVQPEFVACGHHNTAD